MEGAVPRPSVLDRTGRLALVSFALAMASSAAVTEGGQLDPLLPFKLRQPPPNILIVLDTSARMQFDAAGTFYDPHIYARTGEAFEIALGVSEANTASGYRRRLVDLLHSSEPPGLTARFIRVTGDREPDFERFGATTRLQVAKEALLAAIAANRRVVRFGLITTAHAGFQLFPPATEVKVEDAAQQGTTDSGAPGIWLAAIPKPAAANGSYDNVRPPLVAPDGADANEQVAAVLRALPGEAGALVAAGADGPGVIDAPIDNLLKDARAEAERLVREGGSDAICRNTVVVLIVGGGEGTTAASPDARATAGSFLDVRGRRVPVYVVALAPPSGDTTELEELAAASGGQYVEISAAQMEQSAATGPVPEVVRSINIAIQHAFADAADVGRPPSAMLPYGPATDQLVAGPVVATVNLSGARGRTGEILPDTIVYSPHTGEVVPQVSNVLITAGFAVPGDILSPGFPGRLSAYRAYKPVADDTRPSGFRFVADGTPIWAATTPPADSRNIFTILADGSVVPFTRGSAALLGDYLGVPDPEGLIDLVRKQPLGAIISSTPAVLTPPAIVPPPDAAYSVFSRDNEKRRSLVFVGANDGMLHAFDARLGIEVWAFVPFNLLPKLRVLAEGQAVGDFHYFVDGSPRLSDIRTPAGWRTLLIAGQGAGGSYYQAFDVTLDGIGDTIRPDADDVAALLACFAVPGRILPVWSFPRLQTFDWTIPPHGDVSPAATSVEKSIGDTWSDPLVTEVRGAAGRHVAVVGAGELSASRAFSRFGDAGAAGAGTTLCMLDASDGRLLGSRDVGNDGFGEADECRDGTSCERLRNGLVADPAASPGDRGGAGAVYIGDLDGRLWRVPVGAGATGDPAILGGPDLVYDAGPSEPIVSSVALTHESASGRFVFLVTGGQLLPFAPGGGAGQLVGLHEAPGAGGAAISFTSPLGDGGGEWRASAPPVIGADIVFFLANRWTADPCAPPSGAVYALTFGGGIAYNGNGDGKLTAEDRRIAASEVSSAGTALFVAGGHLYVGTAQGVKVLGDREGYNEPHTPVRLRVLSWRDLRGCPYP